MDEEEFLLQWALRTPGLRLQEITVTDLALLKGIAIKVTRSSHSNHHNSSTSSHSHGNNSTSSITSASLYYLPVNTLTKDVKVKQHGAFLIQVFFKA